MKTIIPYDPDIMVEKNLLLMINTVINKYGGAINAEVSFQKGLRNIISWQIEFLGGFPSQTIARMTLEQLKQRILTQLYNLTISKNSKVKIIDILCELKLIVKKIEDRFKDCFPGNIMVAIRTVDKIIIRKEDIKLLNGKIKNNSTFFNEYHRITDLCQTPQAVIIQISSVPPTIIKALCQYKSELFAFFQEISKYVVTCQRLLLNPDFSTRHLKFEYVGGNTQLVLSALIAYSKEAIQEGGIKMNIIKFIHQYSSGFGVNKSSVNRAIQNILETSFDKRIGLQFLKPLKQAIQDLMLNKK